MFCLIAFLLSIIKKNSKKIIICTNFFFVSGPISKIFQTRTRTIHKISDPNSDNSEISDPDPARTRRALVEILVIFLFKLYCMFSTFTVIHFVHEIKKYAYTLVSKKQSYKKTTKLCPIFIADTVDK